VIILHLLAACFDRAHGRGEPGMPSEAAGIHLELALYRSNTRLSG
jgi:hypothetical protein